MKKMATLLVVIVLILQMTIIGFATDGVVSSKHDFIDSEVKKYISIFNPNAFSVSVSDEIPVYDFATEEYNYEAVLIITDGDVLAMMLVAEEDGEYVSTYYDGVADAIKDAYKDGESIVLGVSNNQLLMIDENENMYNLSNSSNVAATLPNALSTNLFESISIRKTLNIITPRIPNIVVQTSLNVNNVLNEGSLCWAACIASVANYLRGAYLNALTVYNDCVSNFGQIPSGTSTWYQRAFLIYNINTAVNGPMSYSNLYGQLMMNRPPIVNLARNDGTSGHALVLSGMVVFYENTTGEYYGTYSFMDPNYEYGNVYVNVGSDTLFYGSSFTYVPSSWDESESIIYSTWLSTITNFG